MSIRTEIQRLAPSSVIELFELDMSVTTSGGKLFYGLRSEERFSFSFTPERTISTHLSSGRELSIYHGRLRRVGSIKRVRVLCLDQR